MDIMNTIAVAISSATTVSDDDRLFAAVCDLRSVVERGQVTVSAEARSEITEALRYCLEQLPEASWAEVLVKAMAALQGLCPASTWTRWLALQGG